VNEQSSIIGASSVTIRTEGHTQIDGAVIANQDAAGNDLGNLSLDTGTLGFSDIKDHDKEDSYYLNVGFNAGDNTGTNQPESGTTYTASGSLSSHDKEQINRATVGDGTITVRDNSEQDLSGLNRDTALARQVTKDEFSSTELYASSTSVKSVGNLVDNPQAQLEQWQTNVTNVASKDAWQEVISNGSTVLERSVLLAKTLGTNLDGSLAQQLGQAGENAIEVAMVQLGMSEAEANAYLLDNPQVVNVIAQLNMVRQAMENPDGFTAEQLAEQSAQIGASTFQKISNDQADAMGTERYLVNGVKMSLTPVQAAAVALGEAQRYMDELAQSNPQAARAAELLIAAATGGPVKGALSLAADKAIEAMAGDKIAQVMDKAANQLGHVISDANANADEFAQDAANENFISQGLIKDGGRFILSSIVGVGVPGKAGSTSPTTTVPGLPEGTGSKSIVDYKELSAGCSGSWCKSLNKPEPNTTYKVDDNYSFTTDERGRTQKVEGQLNLDTADRNKYQQCKAGKCGDAGDEGGHLIASIFNGPGEAINLVPMNGNLNKGAWKVMENDWAAALEQGKSVKVAITPVYIGSSKRPVSFVVVYSKGSDRPVTKTFKNTPGGT
jgi:filamentous hemagglutinin